MPERLPEKSSTPSRTTVDRDWALKRCEMLTTWMNEVFSNSETNTQITDLTRSLADGLTLTSLISELSDEPLRNIEREPQSQQDICHNLYQCLDFLDAKGVNVRDVSVEDVANGNLKSSLNLLENIRMAFGTNNTERVKRHESADILSARRRSHDQHVNRSNADFISQQQPHWMTQRPHSVVPLSGATAPSCHARGNYYRADPKSKSVEDQLRSLILPNHDSLAFDQSSHCHLSAPRSQSAMKYEPSIQLNHHNMELSAHQETPSSLYASKADLRNACSRIYGREATQLGKISRPQSSMKNVSQAEIPDKPFFTNNNMPLSHSCANRGNQPILTSTPEKLLKNAKIAPAENESSLKEDRDLSTIFDNAVTGTNYKRTTVTSNQHGFLFNGIDKITCGQSDNEESQQPMRHAHIASPTSYDDPTVASSVIVNHDVNRLDKNEAKVDVTNSTSESPSPNRHSVDRGGGRRQQLNRNFTKPNESIEPPRVIHADQAEYPSSYRRVGLENVDYNGSIFDMMTDTAASSVRSLTPPLSSGAHEQSASLRPAVVAELSADERVLQLNFSHTDDDDDESVAIDVDNATLTVEQSPRSSMYNEEKLDNLEGMYSDVLYGHGRRKHYKSVNRRYSIASSDTNSVRQERLRENVKMKSKNQRLMQKHIQKLESHVINLARNIASLTSEVRSHDTTLRNVKRLQREVDVLKSKSEGRLTSTVSCKRHMESNDRASHVHSLLSPCRVLKLKRFFGEEPPMLQMFLKELGYEGYSVNFAKEKVGVLELPFMTEDRLEALGIPLGPRLRILHESQIIRLTDSNGFFL